MYSTRYTAPTGFTVVELLVALTLIGVGVVAWVGTSVVAIRIVGAAERESAAAVAVRRQAELLAARACPGPGSGSSEGITWTVDPMPNGVRQVHARLAFAGEDAPRVATAHVAAICR